MKIKYYLLLLVVCLFSIEIVFAIEYPDFPGVNSLDRDSTIGEFANYFYVLIVAVIVAVVVLKIALSGLNLIMSGGNPEEYSKFKNDLTGAFLGVLLILIPFILIQVINDGLGSPEPLECEDLPICVVRETTNPDTGKVVKRNDMNIANQKVPENQTLTIKKYDGLQNIISFHGGPATMIYGDDPQNDDIAYSIANEIVINGPLAGGNGQQDPDDPSKKLSTDGLVIVPKGNGAFLYEMPDYQSVYNPPLHITGVISDLEINKYRDSVKSIDVVNDSNLKNKQFDYFGIAAQENGDMMSVCAVFNNDVPDVDDNQQLAKLGGKINYAALFQRDKTYFKGLKTRITLYNNTSCTGKGFTVQGKVSEEQSRQCEITFINNNGEIDLSKKFDGDDLKYQNVVPDCASDNHKCSVALDAIKTIIVPEMLSRICPNLGGAGKTVPITGQKYTLITQEQKEVEVGYLGKKLVIEFNVQWDGVSEVGISGSSNSIKPVRIDDKLVIENTTNGKKRAYEPESENERDVEIGDIADMLSKGDNNLQFYLEDVGDHKVGIGACWLYNSSEGETIEGSVEVYSFRIDTPSAIVFLDSKDRCNIYTNQRISRGEGVCNQVNFKGKASDEFKPNKIFAVPYDK